MTYSEATKELKRIGCAHATGDSLAAMYARMISFHQGVDRPNRAGKSTKNIYEHLRILDDGGIFERGRELMRDACEAAAVAFSDLDRT